MLEISNIEIEKNGYYSDTYYVHGICSDETQIPINYDDFENEGVYFHRDGIWRRSTFNNDTQEYSGYFANWDQAEQALTDYLYNK